MANSKHFLNVRCHAARILQKYYVCAINNEKILTTGENECRRRCSSADATSELHGTVTIFRNNFCTLT